MSGKTYSFKEMKTIVDYLKTHNAYGDYKGRKMWMDFASSSLTTRTWQSLKETFLKRILPDIHNPYYSLTRDEILSFKEGYDINARKRNKLEIHTISDDSNSNETQKDNQQPSTSKVRGGEKATGENSKPTKIDSHDRASTETVILDPCYETPQDIQRVLESPKNGSNEDPEDNIPPSKSFRDLITYEEPLTPMLQEVLDDFATDDEEPELQIVENVSPDTNDQDPNVSPKNPTNSIPNSEKNGVITENEISKIQNNIEKQVEKQSSDVVENSDTPDTLKTTPTKADSTKKSKDGFEIHSAPILEQPEVDINACTRKSDSTDNCNKPSSHSEEVIVQQKTLERNETQDYTHSTSDTILPGNQEALERNDTIEKKSESLTIPQSSKIGGKKILGRKRANSDVKVNTGKKAKSMGANNKLKSVSEAGSCTEDKQFDFKIPSPVKNLLAETLKSSTLEKPVKVNCNNTETVTSTKEKDEAHTDESQPSKLNPCLNSVSLFAEQFNKTKYTDSESSENFKPNKIKNNKNKNVKNFNEILPETRKADANIKDVVMVQSRSESDSGKIIEQNDLSKDESDKKIRTISSSQRDKALASVFGFACGGNRKRKLSSRKSSHRYYSHSNTLLDSSEWTSESEDEYVSPPRGRKSKQTRKYLKPKSARILALEEEGGLFVMHDKRIYPLIKDGKIIKNYLTYSSDESESEEDTSYWKKKYEEEKIKAEKLKKLLEESKENKNRACSPILPISTLPKLHVHSPIDSNPPVFNTEVQPTELKNIQKPEKTLKIKFTKNNEELQVEGHWSHIHPVLADVVHLFNKDSEPAHKNMDVPTLKNADEPPRKDTDVPNHKIDPPTELASNGKADIEVMSIGSTTVPDEEIHEKVAKLENEIFKEIEERDKEAQSEVPSHDDHVNTRSRQRTPSTTKEHPSPSSSESRTSSRMKNKREQAAEVAVDSNATVADKRKTRSPRKLNVTENGVSISEQKSKPNNTNLKPAVADDDEDTSIRYKLPTTRKTKEKKTPQKVATNTNSKSKINNKRKPNASKIDVPVNLSLNTESTQGYHDSDISPMRDRILLKKKRKLSLSTLLHRGRNRQRHARRRSYPCLSDDASSESSILSFKLPFKITNKLPISDNSSPNTEVYRSDSYQLLMPKEKRPFILLDRIDETNPLYNDVDMGVHNSNLQVIVDGEMFNLYKDSSNSSVRQNSSNVSLPLSPELSVVENISISKELLSGLEDHPTINETQANDLSVQAMYNKYMISEVDVTMPLMAQDCEIQKSMSPDQSSQKATAVSESLLSKINSVNIADAPSISDSLDNKLRNLLLESAKKMQVDTINVTRINKSALEKKARAKKRCSTPRKKKGTIKSKTPEVEPVIEEERMECCSHGGRRSCPPAIQMLPKLSVNIEKINASVNEPDKTKGRKRNASVNEPVKSKGIKKNAGVNVPVKSKGRKKKDIIKVKILKPTRRDSKKKESPAKRVPEKKAQNKCNISVQTDSGINEPISGMFIEIDDDSVDLIHNHSETCLQTKECLDNSVKFVDPLPESVITLDDSDQFLGSLLGISEFRDAENLPAELFCSDAHDGISDNISATSTKGTNSEQTSDTVYHSPVSNKNLSNSLITEDLSDELPPQNSLPSKWYLFSEDETTNATNAPSFGANLRQIFPLTCAVPNLSTVTESSKDNEGRSPSDIECDIRNDLDSQSIL